MCGKQPAAVFIYWPCDFVELVYVLLSPFLHWSYLMLLAFHVKPFDAQIHDHPILAQKEPEINKKKHLKMKKENYVNSI